MILMRLDLLDGEPVTVVVAELREQDRLALFMRDARAAFARCDALDEAERGADAADRRAEAAMAGDRE